LPADLANPASIGALATFAEQTLSGVDVLINNAARTEHSRIETLSLEEWRRTLDVNLTGTFLVAQTLGRAMIARGRGKIINLASRCGFVGIPFNAAYNASKAGVMSLTQTLAVEWAAHNVRVNAIVPGFVRTPMTEREAGDPAVFDLFARKIPLRRVSEPTDLIGAAVFLASRASDYMTGTALFVDGGNYASGGIGAEAAAQGPSGE
jgi:2-deoxy-D-gluconate 3-dehydrogenase